MPRLRRADCSKPGLRRRRAGRGFAYYDASGDRVTDPEALARIRALAVPPAWTDVWICSDARGHIQAVGTDARGRRQYRYHDEWRRRRDREKFDRMLLFAERLPSMRRTVGDHLGQDGLGAERVLACAVRLLDLGFFRIGSEGYVEENGSFGLATIEKRHVRLQGDTAIFDYMAKGGKRRVQAVVDPDVLAILRVLKRRRSDAADIGAGILAYRSVVRGRWTDVKSADINAYIREATGGDFTAKDFRTWNATVLAAVALAMSAHAPTSAAARKRAVNRCYQEVAHYLGNTPAVCRSSYVDPRVVDRYLGGTTIGQVVDGFCASSREPVEQAVLALLADDAAMAGEMSFDSQAA